MIITCEYMFPLQIDFHVKYLFLISPGLLPRQRRIKMTFIRLMLVVILAAKFCLLMFSLLKGQFVNRDITEY